MKEHLERERGVEADALKQATRIHNQHPRWSDGTGIGLAGQRLEERHFAEELALAESGELAFPAGHCLGDHDLAGLYYVHLSSVFAFAHDEVAVGIGLLAL